MLTLKSKQDEIAPHGFVIWFSVDFMVALCLLFLLSLFSFVFIGVYFLGFWVYLKYLQRVFWVLFFGLVMEEKGGNKKGVERIFSLPVGMKEGSF